MSGYGDLLAVKNDPGIWAGLRDGLSLDHINAASRDHHVIEVEAIPGNVVKDACPSFAKTFQELADHTFAVATSLNVRRDLAPDTRATRASRWPQAQRS